MLIRAPRLLEAYLKRTFPDIDPRRHASESMGRAFLKQILQGYLRKEYGPWEVCRHVPAIENTYDYPKWLGDLYNACDWVDERATHESHWGVREEAEVLVTKL